MAGLLPAGAEKPDPALVFARAMAAAGPFEHAPHLAVATSGGADSTACLLLAADWAVARGGKVTALVFDHGLRAGSAAEAAAVVALCTRLGLAARVLNWAAPARGPGLQAAARVARYRAFGDWCRAHAVVHLLTGHHAADQAETVAMRLLRGASGGTLAGIAPVVHHPAMRILRPLLGAAPADLRDFLIARTIPWSEDPSNRDERFERARLRPALAGALGQVMLDHLVEDHAAEGRAEAAWQAAALARHVTLTPWGGARIDAGLFAGEPTLATRALSRLVRTLAGRVHPPRTAAAAAFVQRLHPDRLAETLRGGATFGGLAWLSADGGVLVMREFAACAPPVALPATLRPGASLLWDGRFVLRTDRPAEGRGLSLGALGETGIAELREGHGTASVRPAVVGLPRRAWPALPALRRGGRVIGCAFLAPPACLPEGLCITFEPAEPLVR